LSPVDSAKTVLPWALPLSGLPDSPWVQRGGLVPTTLTGRRLFRFRRLSALELWPVTLAVLPGPRWSAAIQGSHTPPALQRFLAADAWLLRPWHFAFRAAPDEQPV
jgi:hypothetical protein